jgi:hypothetical protein
MIDALKRHWPEYLIEGACLALFMVSAFTFGTILEHPASLVQQAIPNPLLRRFLMGSAMGGTAIAIIYSPWGKQSGAHSNPSMTIAFFRLGKIKICDAAFSVCRRLAGRVGGFNDAFDVGVAPFSQLCRDGTRICGSNCGIRRRGRDCVHPDDGHPIRLEQPAAAQTNRALRRRIGDDLHHIRSADLRNEHEPGT